MMNRETKYILFFAIVSAMGGLLFGYDWVVIGGAKPFYEVYFNITDNSLLQGWAMSSALIGCLFGAMISGYLSDRYGRKPILIVASLFFFTSAIGTGIANNFDWFIFYRIWGGIGIGLASNISPMYISEISPAKSRGRLVAVYQMSVVLGILAAQFINWTIALPIDPGSTNADILESWNGTTGWRWMFWAEGVPAGLFMILAFFIPESPRWLIGKEKFEMASVVLSKINHSYSDVQTEIQTIKQSFSKENIPSFYELFKGRNGRILTVGIVLAVFQQWCGINVIFNYAQEVFESAGFNVSQILLNIVITGVANVIFTILAMIFVDKIGRRPLVLFGSIFLAVIYFILGAVLQKNITGILPLALVILAIGVYAMTLAAVVWVIIAEIFPNSIRSKGMSISTLSLWIACFVLTYTFPPLNNLLGISGTFYMYGTICIAGFAFIYKYLPETKCKSLEEIGSSFDK